MKAGGQTRDPMTTERWRCANCGQVFAAGDPLHGDGFTEDALGEVRPVTLHLRQSKSNETTICGPAKEVKSCV